MSERERLQELVTRHVTEKLPERETDELARLLAAESDAGVEEFELAAAALDQALTRVEEPLPEDVKSRVKQRLHQQISPAQWSQAAEQRRGRSAGGASWTATGLPWLAAAAALVIALVGWWPRSGSVPELGPSERRQEIAALPDTLSRGWTATEDPAAGEASGDVIWSDSEQRGYMRISGLAANDPTREQYQLWIFDRDRDERYPVDGGVFDIPAGPDEILVPIDAKLPVNEPYLFAITVEPPGGVVVSNRERIVLVAEV